MWAGGGGAQNVSYLLFSHFVAAPPLLFLTTEQKHALIQKCDYIYREN